MPDSLSASKQDYLETILEFSAESGKARSIDIARTLGVSRASVNKSLSVLKETGLVEHEHYGDVRLTAEGLRMARAIRGRHVMLKAFLSEVLGLPADTAERDACRMEHAICTETAEKFADYLSKILEEKKIHHAP